MTSRPSRSGKPRSRMIAAYSTLLVAPPEPVSSTRDHLRPSGKLLSLGGIWAHLEYGLKRARLQWYSGGLGETSFNVRIAGLRVCGGHIACDRCCGLRDRW